MDYDYRVEAKRIVGDAHCGMWFRCTDAGDRLHYAFGTNNHLATLMQQLGGLWSGESITHEIGAVENDRWYTLLVSVRGSQVRCCVDGELAFLTDAWDQHPKGAVGLHANGSRFAFRNIKVTAPDGKVLLAGLPDLSPPTPLPPVAGVAVVRGADGARVKTANYDALLGSDGCLYSLTAGGVEFLRPGEPLLNGKSVARGAYFYYEKPPYQGVVAMPKIEQTAGNVFKAGGDKFSVTYEFAPDAVRLKATNATDEMVRFFVVLDSASVANLVNDGGDQLSVPVVGQPGSKWETTTWAAGRSALKIVRTDPGDVKLWGPFGKAKSQVWEGDVGSYQTAEIRLEPTAHQEAEATNRPAPAADGFTSLFNGKDISTNWSVETGLASQWKAEDEAIVGKTDGYPTRSYLLTTKDYADFILRLEYKVDPESGGGLTFRTIDDEKLPLGSGQVIADHPLIKLTDPAKFPDEPSGTTYWVKDDKTYCKPVEDVKAAAGEWHRMEVTVRGDACSALLDEKKVVELRLEAGDGPSITPALKRTKGRLGFQAHTGTIRFRRIEIKELTAATAETTSTENDPIRDKLDKAKAAFDAAVEKYQKRVHDGLDKVEENATKAGKTDIVGQVQAEREAFDNSGDLPKSLPSAVEYKRDEDAARWILDAAYATAVKAYGNEKMETKAEAVKEERRLFQEGHPTDAFRAGSVWKGNAVQVWIGHPDRPVSDCSLTVLERDDKSFKAVVVERGNTLEANGTIRGGVIRWLAKDVKVIRGGPEHDSVGKLTGNVVELQSEWLGAYRGKPNATVLTVHLQLVKK